MARSEPASVPLVGGCGGDAPRKRVTTYCPPLAQASVMARSEPAWVPLVEVAGRRAPQEHERRGQILGVAHGHTTAEL
jgi:hypothetical protein